ncbi:MAG: RsmE family RNA methyltransferase [Candidatus Gastranaerophilales bacterium]|nr:RsmE family RNA methyltransferase [Candidatus Gastranaerophilales bacterium]
MPHFLIKKEEIFNSFIELKTNENLFHITKVLRAKCGEKIKFIDENQIVYHCEINEISKNYLKANILTSEKSQRILNYNLCLIQSILAPDAQNLAIANAVQTGVKEIYPVISDNVSQSLKTLENKKEKWEKIAIENFKQCERADLATIQPIKTLKEALEEFKKENILIFAEKYVNIELNKALVDINKQEKIAVVIGPEGGFSQKEFEYFIDNKYKLISLGNMIYKAPNAITAGISNVITRI